MQLLTLLRILSHLGVLIYLVCFCNLIAKPLQAKHTVRPSEFIIRSFESGDRACYLTVELTVTKNPQKIGSEYLMASFDFCDKRYLNKRVKAKWSKISTLHPNCEGDMGCGLSLKEWVVVDLEVDSSNKSR